MTDAGRVRAARYAAAAALATGLLLVPRLWMGPREFPAATVWGIDQQLFQPWIFQELFLLGFLLLVRRPDAALSACRLVVAGTYFWSGLQKLNATYVTWVFPWLTGGAELPAYAAVLSAVVEAGIGLALLHHKTRDAAVLAAAGMHVFIIVALSALGWNVVVWPWGLMMVAMVFALFWRVKGGGLEVLIPKGRVGAVLVAWIFFIAMPFLTLFGAWDSYLSSALYTGSISAGSLIVPATHAERLPPSARAVAVPEGSDVRVSLMLWSLEDLNLPDYPEPRAFKAVARRACAMLGSPERMRLEITYRFTALHPVRIETLTCAELEETKSGP